MYPLLPVPHSWDPVLWAEFWDPCEPAGWCGCAGRKVLSPVRQGTGEQRGWLSGSRGSAWEQRWFFTTDDREKLLLVLMSVCPRERVKELGWHWRALE